MRKSRSDTAISNFVNRTKCLTSPSGTRVRARMAREPAPGTHIP